MEKLRRQDLPEDYRYYRSHSETFFSWLLQYAERNGAKKIVEKGFYGMAKSFFGLFWMASFEKCDFEPTRELLDVCGFGNGWVVWSPLRKNSPEAKGWRKLPYFLAHEFHFSTRSAFSVLDTQEYWKKWKSGPRGHRNKIQKRLASGEIRIDTNASLEDFLATYRKSPVPHGWKNYLITRQKFLSARNDGNIRIFLAYIGDEPLA